LSGLPSRRSNFKGFLFGVMALKEVKVDIKMRVVVKIDTEDPVVMEYESEKELIEHLVSYRFSEVLPVMKTGVQVKYNDCEIIKTEPNER